MDIFERREELRKELNLILDEINEMTGENFSGKIIDDTGYVLKDSDKPNTYDNMILGYSYNDGLIRSTKFALDVAKKVQQKEKERLIEKLNKM